MLHRALPNPGDLIAGKYQVVKKLGEGGMGVVYEAIHTRIQQRVAIKMLLPDVMELPEVVPRFEREARAAGKLKSDNTARVLDVDMSENGLPYMVMEFLDGVDLGQLLEKNGALPVQDAVDYVLQACNAMAEAHAAGVIHRDLKPSNLFVLTNTGGTRKVKVLDFGISKLENETEARVTATQAVVGTPLYMSPEQVRSAKHVDARSDIWSLGIILYELVTARTPFEGSTTAAAAAICIDDPPPIAQFRQDVPADLERAILIALQKEPSARFPNVQLLAQAIAPFGSGSIIAPDTAPAAFLVPGSVSSPRLPMTSRPELGSAPTIHSDPGISGARAAANPHTLPGWTTRSSPGRRRSKTIITVVVTTVMVLSLVIVGVVAVGFAYHKSPDPVVAATATAETHATATATITATATEAAIVTAPVTTSGSSPSTLPSTRPTSRPRPTATVTATAAPTATHTTAPAPTRL
jgi:serine/threonine-protein kinase